MIGVWELGGPPEWHGGALCAQIGDPDLWHPGKGDGGREAKAICARCDVREACRDWALGYEAAGHTAFGIYGGLTAQERTQIRRAPRARRGAA